MKKGKGWQSNIKDLGAIDVAMGNLLLSQGETVLKETAETGKLISSRADRFLAIKIPIASVLSVYALNNCSHITSFLPLSALLSLIVIGISLFYTYQNLSNYTISIPGEYPKILAITEYFDNQLSAEKKYANLILAICEDIQLRIDNNDASNEKRVANNEKALNILLILPACPVIAAVFCWILKYHSCCS
jgi:hypothetical protein